MKDTELLLLGAAAFMFYQLTLVDTAQAAPPTAPTPILTPTKLTESVTARIDTPYFDALTPLNKNLTEKILVAGIAPTFMTALAVEPVIHTAKVQAGPTKTAAQSKSSSSSSGTVSQVYLSSTNPAVAANAAAWASSGRTIPVALR